jgi:hypothetical protein
MEPRWRVSLLVGWANTAEAAPNETSTRNRLTLACLSSIVTEPLNSGPYPMGESPKIPTEAVTRLRSLAHELSNAIEIVMQAAYLLGHAELDEDSQKWLAVHSASRDAARINRELRDILRSHSQ